MSAERSWRITVAAETPVVDLDNAKEHLGVTEAQDDAYIETLVSVATDMYMEIAGIAILAQTAELLLDDFPSSDASPIYLPLSPLIAVSSITYYDADGVQQTLDESDYHVSPIGCIPPRILPADGKMWPLTRELPGDVVLTFTCGAETADARDVHAVKLLLAHLYENREVTDGGATLHTPHDLPMGLEAIINMRRVRIPPQG